MAALLGAGRGDAVQVAKAGILEIADVFVVNKADREGADTAVRDLEQMLRMGPELEWTPPVVKTAAASSEGMEDLSDAIEEHRAHLEASNGLERRRRERLLHEVETLAIEGTRDRAHRVLSDDRKLVEDLLAKRTDPYRAAAILAERLAGDP